MTFCYPDSVVWLWQYRTRVGESSNFLIHVMVKRDESITVCCVGLGRRLGTVISCSNGAAGAGRLPPPVPLGPPAGMMLFPNPLPLHLPLASPSVEGVEPPPTPRPPLRGSFGRKGVGVWGCGLCPGPEKRREGEEKRGRTTQCQCSVQCSPGQRRSRVSGVGIQTAGPGQVRGGQGTPGQGCRAWPRPQPPHAASRRVTQRHVTLGQASHRSSVTTT